MIEFPHDLGPQSFTMRLVDFGGVMRPALGGAVTRVNRLGNRYAADVTMPPLEFERGRLFVSRLIRARSEGLRMEIPLTLGKQGVPGVGATVDGAVAGGTSLAVKGVNPGWVAKEGYWLSVVKSGQHYAHNICAQAVADGTGDITLTIEPELRVSLADGDVVNLARPMIEGFVEGDGWEWSLAHHAMISFTIEEAA